MTGTEARQNAQLVKLLAEREAEKSRLAQLIAAAEEARDYLSQDVNWDLPPSEDSSASRDLATRLTRALAAIRPPTNPRPGPPSTS